MIIEILAESPDVDIALGDVLPDFLGTFRTLSVRVDTNPTKLLW